MSKVMIANADKCTGCRVCELACSVFKTGEYNPSLSSIRILQNREFDISIPAIQADCTQCGECVKWCFTGAIKFMEAKEAALVRKRSKIGIFPVPFL